MKFQILLIFNLSVALFANASKHDEAVEKLLRQMTLEEKVGQMAQVTVDIMKDPDRKSVV